MRKEKSELSSTNIIATGTQISGSLNTINDLRIDGSIDGNVSAQSKIVIGPNGIVNGDLSCAEALIEGKIEGNILCKGFLHIRATAKIDGNMDCTGLIVEDGAYFNGNCSMNAKGTKI